MLPAVGSPVPSDEHSGAETICLLPEAVEVTPDERLGEALLLQIQK
jgi:hypothetical protein